jgi:hypothetical protein
MWRDEIVEEVRKARDEYAAKFNYDIRAIARDMRERQERSGETIVRLKSKKTEEKSTE